MKFALSLFQNMLCGDYLRIAAEHHMTKVQKVHFTQDAQRALRLQISYLFLLASVLNGAGDTIRRYLRWCDSEFNRCSTDREVAPEHVCIKPAMWH